MVYVQQLMHISCARANDPKIIRIWGAQFNTPPRNHLKGEGHSIKGNYFVSADENLAICVVGSISAALSCLVYP